MDDFYNIDFHSAYCGVTSYTCPNKKKLLDLVYIYPRGVRGGAALFCWWKVFLRNTLILKLYLTMKRSKLKPVPQISVLLFAETLGGGQDFFGKERLPYVCQNGDVSLHCHHDVHQCGDQTQIHLFQKSFLTQIWSVYKTQIRWPTSHNIIISHYVENAANHLILSRTVRDKVWILPFHRKVGKVFPTSWWKGKIWTLSDYIISCA